MDDLISRQVAIELIHSLYPSAPIMRINRKQWEKKYKPYIEAEKALEQLPSADPEPSQLAKDIARILENDQDMRVILKNAETEIVRCKDCKFRDEGYRQTTVKWLPCMEMMTGGNWFCGSAERREDE